ncbi:hypothetical protein BC940DRAFT_286757 [Gongronella butleri]|nr:hypothetical protein BC940DRAFT_286757 [Gongronella butleri]
MPPESKPAASQNKDLSCLRCRKKKAKCSKTRPSCTRCERSNQPCEYPDAPPNLTDLSQKVLSLYESLRDLEGEFLVKYMQPEGDDAVDDHDDDDADDAALSASSPAPVVLAGVGADDVGGRGENDITGGWSMTLVPDGMSIQSKTRTASEFIVFMTRLTRQLFPEEENDDPLANAWELDDGGSLEKEEEEEETNVGHEGMDLLDEDDYLVTVPLFPLSYFSLNASVCASDGHGGATTPQRSTDKAPLSQNEPLALATLLLSPQDLVDHILMVLTHDAHSADDQALDAVLVRLLLQELAPYLPSPSATRTVLTAFDSIHDLAPLQQSILLAAFLAAHLFFHRSGLLQQHATWTPITVFDALRDALLDCVLLFPPTPPLQLALLLFLCCHVRLLNEARAAPSIDTLSLWLVFAWRSLMVDSATNGSKSHQFMVATLFYLDIHTHTFVLPPHTPSPSQRPVFDAVIKPLSAHAPSGPHLVQLHAQAMAFLAQVQALFYVHEPSAMVMDKDGIHKRLHTPMATNDNENDNDAAFMQDTIPSFQTKMRKVDVDEVLTLVRDLETWEQQLPIWAAWKDVSPSSTSTLSSSPPAIVIVDANDDTIKKEILENNHTAHPSKKQRKDDKDAPSSPLSPLVIQLHVTLNVVKILLFRPFCCTGPEQTYTKTTFLDLSLHAASRLAACVQHTNIDPAWRHAAHQLIWDVVDRVKTTFDSDTDIQAQLHALVNRML